MWNKNCIYAPTKEFAKHCKKENIGTKEKPPKANKGYFGCAHKCRFLKVRK